MTKAARPCATPGCPNLTDKGTSRCDTCQRDRDANYRKRRDPTTHKHYNSKAHRRFRRLVLDRDRLCVLCGDIATDADHYPKDLRQLLADGDNPNDPANGRGLCRSCHSRETIRLGQGGWSPTPQGTTPAPPTSLGR